MSKKALIVSGNERAAEYFIDMLPLMGFTDTLYESNGYSAKNRLDEMAYNVVIINTPLIDEAGNELALFISRNYSCGVVIIVKEEDYDKYSALFENEGVFILSRPLSRKMILQTVSVAYTLHLRLDKAEKKNETMKRHIDELKLINHAKWLLISKLGMNEESAHRFIEKHAMDLRQSKYEVSRSIIKTYDNE